MSTIRSLHLHAGMLLLASSLAACSSSDSTDPGGAAGSAGSSTDAAAPEAGASCTETGPLDLGGTWVARLDLELDLSSQAGGAATLCPDQQTGRASMIVIFSNSHPAGSTAIDSVQPVVCSLELPELTGMVGECDPSAPQLMSINLIASPALQKSLHTVPVAPVKASLASTAPGAAITVDRFVVTGGTRKATDPLPAWDATLPGCGPSDANVGRSPTCEQSCVDDCGALVDDDADGWAATTFHICGYTNDDKTSGVQCRAESPSEAGVVVQGKLMMAFLVDPLLQGKALSSCEVRGGADARVLYHVLGGDIYLANSALSVVSSFKSLPLFDVDPKASVFRMVRVDGKHGTQDWGLVGAEPAAACAAALQHVNELL